MLGEEELSVHPQSGETRIKGSFLIRHVTLLALHLPGEPVNLFPNSRLLAFCVAVEQKYFFLVSYSTYS